MAHKRSGRPSTYPHWLDMWAHQETVTIQQLCALLIPRRPDAAVRSSQEYKLAKAWLESQNIPIVEVRSPHQYRLFFVGGGDISPPDFSRQIHYEPGCRLADAIAAIRRQRAPRPFGQDLLDAWDARASEAVLEPKPKTPERRKAAYLEFVARVSKTVRRHWNDEELHRQLYRDDDVLWPKKYSTFRRQFLQTLSPEERDL